MYLSRVRLDLNCLSREQLLHVLSGHAYTAHQILWQLFTDTTDRRPFLFRQEIEHEQRPQAEVKGLPLFYVLSEREPQKAEGLDVQTKSFEPQLKAGQRLSFALRANPTVARPTKNGRSRRSDVLMHAKHSFSIGNQRKSADCQQAMEQAAIDWLADTERCHRAGFEPDVGTLVVAAYRRHEIKKPNTGHIVRFSSVDYSGVLHVTDPGKFMQTLSSGLGRAKAFGCGLMLIRRVD